MARILSISSQVVRGHVGNSASVIAMRRLGHEVWPLPTVVLSNHPGHGSVAGLRIPPETLLAMVQALADNEWLTEIDAVFTGYLPSAAHVLAAVKIIDMISAVRPKPAILVDPVLGDDPKGLYIDETAAAALRDTLLPSADIATPNRFELSWLSGLPVTDSSTASDASAKLGIASVLATSIPSPGAATMINLLHTPKLEVAVEVPRAERAPHGTGDLLAALFFGHILNGLEPEPALREAVASVQRAIDAAAGSDELRLTSHAW